MCEIYNIMENLERAFLEELALEVMSFVDINSYVMTPNLGSHWMGLNWNVVEIKVKNSTIIFDLPSNGYDIENPLVIVIRKRYPDKDGLHSQYREFDQNLIEISRLQEYVRSGIKQPSIFKKIIYCLKSYL